MSVEPASRSRLFWPGALVGGAIMAFAVRGLLHYHRSTNPVATVRLLVGLDIVHDLVLVPVVLLVGVGVARLVPARARAAVVVGLVLSGVAALYAYPFLRGFGRSAATPSRLPNNYATGLVTVLAVVWVVVIVGATAVARRRLAEVALGAAALGVVAWVVVLMARRVGHPFELEWLEGGAVEHVRRVLHGHSLYPAPSIDFVAYPYPPLYWWVSALVATVLGVGFLPLRLVSMAATVATFALLASIVRRETGNLPAGLVAAAVYAASFGATALWFDVARVDALFLALFVAALGVAARAHSMRDAVIAGSLFGLSALTKQTAVFAAVPVLVGLVVRRPRIGAMSVGVAVGVAGAVSLWLDIASHGWYRAAVLDQLVGHDIDRRSVGGFWRLDLWHHLWPTALLVVVASVLFARAGRLPGVGVYLAGSVGMVAAAYVSRLHSGDAPNVLMPAFAAAALWAGFATAALVRSRPGAVLACVAVALQLLLLARGLSAALPPSSNAAAGRALEAAIARVHGDVLVVSHPTYGVAAGKRSHAQAGAISDVVRSRRRQPRAVLQASIAQAVHEQRFAAIVFDGADDHLGFPADFDHWYRQVPWPGAGVGPHPVSDPARTPTEWWVPLRACPTDCAVATQRSIAR